MKSLKGAKTHANLKDAFAGESQANRRYLYFAKVADVEGQPEIAGLFRNTAKGETGHAHGHLDYLKQVGDPATDQPIGDSMLTEQLVTHFDIHFWEELGNGRIHAGHDDVVVMHLSCVGNHRNLERLREGAKLAAWLMPPTRFVSN